MEKTLIGIFPYKLGCPVHGDTQLESTTAKQQYMTQQMKSARQKIIKMQTKWAEKIFLASRYL